MSSNIVSVEQLKARLENGERIVLLDVRFDPKESSYGREAYAKGHIPGALFIDFKADLTDPAEKHGGRSPLPSPERLATLFGSLGIERDTAVVAYEDGNGPAASRLWWVLRYLGAEQVQVLNGGYSAWTDAGEAVSAEQVIVTEPREFVPAPQADWLVGVEEVREVAGDQRQGGARLVDSRDAAQYAGLEAPFDHISGHIPGAANYFWKDALQGDGFWKSPEQLREQFANLPKEDEIIVYCGSGISATPNVLALREAGYENVKLYAGSWSDWISYDENPIATGDE
ncbi:3-mercaptopyruvate sulfurtransferase [Bacillus sp. FJAT-27264]|uniref:sulfurtransferase n=1 Tax=Paenibacillus sp. (strain DSM 101736 / FJAT-27264) TaxID=1850362 RepID=UPI000807B54B|nr:sulfurtransferase [Bacillus sp. FJAT-27264]OBZ14360.1 3-mercaptopyruvate sulfurtransferase [Bacillus sp. FJAT-27264]